MMQTGKRYGMSTMEDAVADLVESGIVSKEDARAVLIKAADEGEDRDGGDYAAAAVGGGKLTGAPSPKNPVKPKSDAPPTKDEGYSF